MTTTTLADDYAETLLSNFTHADECPNGAIFGHYDDNDCDSGNLDAYEWLDEQLEVEASMTEPEGRLESVTITVTVGGPNAYVQVDPDGGLVTVHWGDNASRALPRDAADELWDVLENLYAS